MKRSITASIAALCAVALPLVAACGTDAASGGETERLQLATYLGPSTPYGQALAWMAEEAEQRSDGTLEIELYYEGSLLGGADVLPGVRDRRADLGYSTISYHPSELPLTQILSVPFVNDDLLAASAAFEDLYENNADYREEWSSLDLRLLGMFATSPMILLTAEPVESYDWLSGKAVRATSLTGNAVQAAGGNAMALQLGEVYEAAERGLIQGVASIPLGTVPSTSLQEVMAWAADPGVGIYSATMLFINESVYDGLSDDHKALIDELGSEFGRVYLEKDAETDDAACADLIAEGGDAVVWPEAETEKWRSELGDSILAEWREQADNGERDAESFYTQYMSILEGAASDYQSGISRCADR